LIATVIIIENKSIIYIRYFNFSISFNKEEQELQGPQKSVIFRTQNMLETIREKEILQFSV
jgi:hypothetical protein